MLCNAKALSSPVLYLSLYLKANRTSYYELLNRVRFNGAWEEWLDFFLTGVIEVAEQATVAAKRIIALFETDKTRIKSLGRVASTVLRIHEHLQSKPISTIGQAADATAVSYPTAASAIHRLVELGILREITGRKRDCYYQYDAYLSVLGEGTEPLRPSL